MLVRRLLPPRERKPAARMNMAHPNPTRKKKTRTTTRNQTQKRLLGISKSRLPSLGVRISIMSEQNSKMNQFLDKLLELPNFRSLDRNSIKKYLIGNKQTMKHARAITGDFIQILQTEDLRPDEQYTGLIASKIASNCDNNFQFDIRTGGQSICFCCGEPIDVNERGKPIGVACDHVIPIVTMLMTITPDSVPNNLHYIHSTCNSNKLNRNIFEVYENIGLPGGIFIKCKNDKRDICREKFIKILSSLNFRDVDNIEYRLNCLQMFNQDIDELKEKYSFYFNDKRSAAMALTELRTAQREVAPIEEARSIRSRSRSRSSSSSSSSSS